MKRLGRLRSLSYLVLALLILLGGARLVLSSGFAADKVADRLGTLLGVPVRLTRVDIALGGSSAVQGLQIFEADDARADAPWVTANEVRADVSALDLFGNAPMPKEVILSGSSVELRFGENGALLTRLPKSTGSTQEMPKLRLENARLTIKQAGRERRPLVVTGVTAAFTSTDRTFQFAGTCADSYWGDWTVAGSYDTAQDVFRLKLRTARTAVTAEKLALLPFVPEEVWEEVKIVEGITPVELDLTARGNEPVTYRVSLKPVNTRLRVSCIDLDAEQASGEVVIEDSLVTLRNVKGQTANGIIGTEADLDYRGDNAHLKFTTIHVNKVELHRLPESWSLREQQIHGKLTGEASLDLLLKPDGVKTNGSGKGVVSEGIFHNLPIFAPISLKLSTDKDKIRIFPTATALFPGI